MGTSTRGRWLWAGVATTLLVGVDDATVPLFDTARIHAEDAADWAMEGLGA